MLLDDLVPMTPDTETYVVDAVTSAVMEAFPTAVVYGEEVDSPSQFPCVTVEEYNNYSHKQTLTGDNSQRYVHVSYQINVYSNAKNGKTVCKKIMTIVDQMMRTIGFLRTYNAPQPNMQRNIARRVARFNGIVDTVTGLVYKSVYQVAE